MSGVTTILRELEGMVGEANLLTATAAVSEYQVENQQPLGVALPASAEEVAALLRTASEARLSVLVRGAGRHLYLGAPPGPIGLVISLARLNRIVEYDADNLTVTAEGGVSLGELQRVVGERGQMLPLDPPGPESATLGGLAAANLAGPLRMRYGAPRDLVIGLRVALTNGSVVKTGGKTVKNVAGYELSKLFVGSLGTVGAICEVTLRLEPVPEARAMAMVALSPAEAKGMASHLLSSPLEVSSLDLLNYEAARMMKWSLPVTMQPEKWVVFIGLMGEREAIDRQAGEIRALATNGCARLEGEEAEGIWRELRQVTYPREVGARVVRISVPMARASESLEEVSALEGWWGSARAGDGVVYGGAPREEDLGQTERYLVAVRKSAEQKGGWAILESGPVELKERFAVWGEEVADLNLMRRLKESYDPTRILGCGRYLPGL